MDEDRALYFSGWDVSVEADNFISGFISGVNDGVGFVHPLYKCSLGIFVSEETEGKFD